jgi:hypothetical protein
VVSGGIPYRYGPVDGCCLCIFSGTPARSFAAYQKRTAAIKSWLPSDKLARLRALEAKQDYDNPEYERIMMEDLYPLMLCRIQPWPEPVARSFRLMNEKIYEQMQGKSEFLVTGNLKNWERWDRLHEIKTRALTYSRHFGQVLKPSCNLPSQVVNDQGRSHQESTRQFALSFPPARNSGGGGRSRLVCLPKNSHASLSVVLRVSPSLN